MTEQENETRKGSRSGRGRSAEEKKATREQEHKYLIKVKNCDGDEATRAISKDMKESIANWGSALSKDDLLDISRQWSATHIKRNDACTLRPSLDVVFESSGHCLYSLVGAADAAN